MSTLPAFLQNTISQFPALEQNLRLNLHRLRLKTFDPTALDSESKEQKILSEVQKNGYYVLENYFSEDWCEAAQKIVKTVINGDHDFVHKKEDRRLFKAQNLSPEIQNFYADPFFQKLADLYYEEPSKPFITMANWIWHDDNITLGSGGDWHRDSEFRQIKAIVYLTDVAEDNGPFQMIEGSNSDNSKNFNTDTKLMQNHSLSNRLTGDQVGKILKKEPDRLKTFTATKGTVILADTSALHRGCPLRKGERLAIFNYYFADSAKDPGWADKKFAPLVPENFKIT